MFIHIYAATTTVLVIVIWPIVKDLLTSWKQMQMLRNVPMPDAPSWVWGHAPIFQTTKSPMILAGWVVRYGGVFRIRLLHKWAVIVTEPALVRAVLQSSKTYVPKERQLYRSMESASHPALPNILTSSDAAAGSSSSSGGRYWAAVRAAWMKCFTSTNLKRVFPTVISLCETVIEQQERAAAAAAVAAVAVAAAVAAATTSDGAAGAAGAAAEGGWSRVNMCDLTDRITLDVIGVVAYGRDFGAISEKRNRYLQLVSGMLVLMHEEMDHPFKTMLRKLCPDKKKAQLKAEWDAVNTAEVMTAIQHPPGDHTIAGQLLQVLDPATQAPLTLNQLKAEMVIAALAGFETTSNALSWTLAALACHPHVMQELEQELDAAGLLATPQNPLPPAFAWQQLGKLQFLQSVVREGLRLFSPAANGSFRLNVAKDLCLREGLVIPKGTAVGVPFFAFGHNPATYGADVEAFRPGRWQAHRQSVTASSSSSNSGKQAAVLASNSSTTDRHGVGQGSSTAAAGADSGSNPTTAAATGPAAAAAAADASLTLTVPAKQQQQQLQDPWSFSLGPRDCAGQALARMELQVLIAMLVGRMHIKLDPSVGGWEGLLRRRFYHTTLQIEGGLPMLLQPRIQHFAKE